MATSQNAITHGPDGSEFRKFRCIAFKPLVPFMTADQLPASKMKECFSVRSMPERSGTAKTRVSINPHDPDAVGKVKDRQESTER
jgi:hypothetical protein